jgi:hypothetical protein
LRTPTLRKFDERDQVRKAKEKNAQPRLQASGGGTDTDMSYISSQKRRSAGSPLKMIGRHAARVHPPLRGGVEPEGSTSAGCGSPTMTSRSVCRSKAAAGGVRAKQSRSKQAVGRGARETWQKKTQIQEELKTVFIRGHSTYLETSMCFPLGVGRRTRGKKSGEVQ